MEKYNLICQIGHGACGFVYLVRRKDSKKLYALKKIELDETRKTRTKEAVQREAQIMAELKHPHIVTYHESFFDESGKHLCIIQDYCDGGTLEDRLKEMIQKKEHFPEKQIIQWFLQIAMAVRYMHSEKVLHRDLKSPNIFLNKSGTLCKLGDFGIAKNMDTTIDVASTCVGTPCYLSPEMCQDIPYTSKADVWALGCLLYEMCALKPAFDANNLVSLFYKIVKAEFEPISDIYSDDLQNLVNYVLIKLPEERPSARGVLSHPFLRRELLKFIEEKEFILQQRRLPTRQGSRPYTTPALRSVPKPEENSLPGAALTLLPSQVQRATSCRPNIADVGKDKNVLSDKNPPAPGHCGRVSTIQEESEEALLERSLRLLPGAAAAEDHLQLQLSFLHEDGESSSSEEDNLDTTDLPRNKRKSSTGSLNKSRSDSQMKHDKSRSDKPSVIRRSSSYDLETKRKTSKDNLSSKTPDLNRRDSREADGRKSATPPEMGKKANVTSQGKENRSNTESANPDPPKKTKMSLGSARRADPEKSDKPRMRIKSSVEGKTQIKTPRKIADTKKDDLKKSKIQEPLRTPRVIEPNPLRIQAPKHKQAKNELKSVIKNNPETSKSQAKNNTTTLKPPEQQKMNNKNRSKDALSRVKNDKNSKKKTVRGLAREKSGEGDLDNYSDDFEEDGSGSEIEEDLPDEALSQARMARSYSFTTTATIEIPEILEDVPDDAASGSSSDDDEIVDESSTNDANENLDAVVSEARHIHEDLEEPHKEEETIVDVSTRMASANQLIRRHCINALGEEKYQTIKTYWQNNGSKMEISNLEKMIGGDHMKTVYLMHEVLKKEDLNK